jgi:PAS domain S-box-containing protein
MGSDHDRTKDELIEELEALRARERRLQALVRDARIGDTDRRFRALFDQSSEFGAVLAPDGTVILLNQSARTALLEDGASVVGELFWETPWWSHSDEMRDRVRSAVSRAAAGEMVRLETLDVDRGGEQHTVDAVFSPIRNEAGEVGLVLALGRDITELKRAESVLREGEQRYRTLVEHAPEAITVFDMDAGVFVDVNARACELFGLSRDRLLASSPADLSPPLQPDGRPSSEAAFEMLQRAVAGETPQFEWVHTDSRGREIPCEVHLVRLPSAEDTLVRGATFDIGARKEAERALRESEERYATLVANLPSVTWATDAHGNTAFISPNVEQVYGYTAREIIEAGPDLWFGRIDPEHVERVREEYAALFDGDDTRFDTEYRIQRKDGEWIWIRDTAAITPDDEHGDLAYGVFSDITAEKQAEEDLRAAEAQLMQAQKMEAIGRLAGGVAHDFNNLLTIINAHSEFAVERLPDGDPLSADVQIVLDAGRKAAALTRQLLAFSRRQLLEPRVMDLNEVVGTIERMLRRMIGDDIELATVLAEDLGMVMADPGQMEQVLMNLAVNSRDAMPRGGRLIIGTSNTVLDSDQAGRFGAEPGPHVRLTVTDTGTGIDPDDQERVFEPFYTTKKEGEGTGLGLATVFGIVTQSGGHIRLASEAGNGTTFEIYLPRIDAEKPDPGPVTGTDELKGTETILVVEDDTAVRRLTTRVLASAGYDVISAASGGDALLEWERRSGSIQLLLTDVMMPKMGGPELSARLTRDVPGLRTLFMTGYTDDVGQRTGLGEEGVKVIHKPFRPRELLQRVRSVLDERHHR